MEDESNTATTPEEATKKRSLPLHPKQIKRMVYLFKRAKIKEGLIEAKREKNRARNKQARKSRRKNRILKYGNR